MKAIFIARAVNWIGLQEAKFAQLGSNRQQLVVGIQRLGLNPPTSSSLTVLVARICLEMLRHFDLCAREVSESADCRSKMYRVQRYGIWIAGPCQQTAATDQRPFAPAR